jgi:hypothetical protein
MLLGLGTFLSWCLVNHVSFRFLFSCLAWPRVLKVIWSAHIEWKKSSKLVFQRILFALFLDAAIEWSSILAFPSALWIPLLYLISYRIISPYKSLDGLKLFLYFFLKRVFLNLLPAAFLVALAPACWRHWLMLWLLGFWRFLDLGLRH